METLDETDWDVVISGTGIQPSLLALALSRSSKKILHLDGNDYYGGAAAALSLQDAEAWVKRVNSSSAPQRTFSNAQIWNSTEVIAEDGSKLSYSRAYSLALAPQIIYARSELLGKLVSSKVYRQLEFVAVGSWFVYKAPAQPSEALPEAGSPAGTLLRIPSSREDVFADQTLDLNGRRRLMKFLRFVADLENATDHEWKRPESPLRHFGPFLDQKFGISRELQDPIFALTLCQCPPHELMTEDALRNIARHLQSIGVFGRGFGSVIPKWGGLSEISQVGCRAAAVGGATYVLNKAIWSHTVAAGTAAPSSTGTADGKISVNLQDGETLTSKWLVTSDESDLERVAAQSNDPSGSSFLCRSISIVASTLKSLFPPIAEGSPGPAGALVYYPANESSDGATSGAMYLHIRSADTGECPVGQCVIYASMAVGGAHAHTGLQSAAISSLEQAVASLLDAVQEKPTPRVLWRLTYMQQSSSRPEPPSMDGQVLRFFDTGMGVEFDDTILDHVQHAWRAIMGEEALLGDFLRFADREAYDDDEEDTTA